MFSAFYALETAVRRAVDAGDFNEALDRVIDFTTTIRHTQHAHGELIGSRKLDELCSFIGRKYYERHPVKAEAQSSDRNASGTAVVLCTGLYRYGGTSLVIGDLIRACSKFDCVVLATNLLDDIDDGNLRWSRIGGAEATVLAAPRLNTVQKLEWLALNLARSSPSRIFLLNHPQDAVIIAAVQPFLKTGRVIFYHHADHNLCLGVYLDGAIHADPHNVGFYNCRDINHITDNVYLPMTIDGAGLPVRSKRFLENDELITCASGTYHKFANFYLYSYLDIVSARLKARNGRHVHIGNMSADDLAAMRARLSTHHIDTDRFVHLSWVPSLWSALLAEKVDLFIASFPIGGARTTIEVMGAGIPILAHENYLSRFHSSRDIIYPEAPFWKYPDRFGDIMASVDQQFLLMQSAYSRRHFDLYYSSQTIDLEKEIDNICSGQSTAAIPPLYSYDPDQLDWTLHFSHLDYLARKHARESR